VHALAVPSAVPVEHLGQRSRGERRRFRGRYRRGDRCRRTGSAAERLRRGGGREQVAHGLGFAQQRLRQLNAELPLQSQHQLGTGQTVEPEIAVEPALRRHLQARGAVRTQFERQLAHHRQQPIAEVCFRHAM